MSKTAQKPFQGVNVCTYCGAENPDSESICPNTGTRHHLISATDKSSQTSLGNDTPYDVNKPQGQKVAHGFDPGDDSIVRHCPFCGSGNVWGKSDGNVHCEFCGKDYTVQVQPEYPQAVQNLQGVPLGMSGVEDGFDEQGNPIAGDPAQMGGDGPPTASEGGIMPDEGGDGGEEDEDEEGDEEGSPEDEEDQGKDNDQPEFLKKKTSLQERAHQILAVRKGWPIGSRLDRHFTSPAPDGHGWDEEKLHRLPGGWRQERHDRAHGLGAVLWDTDDLPDEPGHEHWHSEDFYADEGRKMQRYRRKMAGLFFTASGNVLNEDDMINHLAIRHADNRTAVIGMVQEFNYHKKAMHEALEGVPKGSHVSLEVHSYAPGGDGKPVGTGRISGVVMNNTPEHLHILDSEGDVARIPHSHIRDVSLAGNN